MDTAPDDAKPNPLPPDDISICETLDLDTGQDVLDLGSSFVFNPVQKTPPLPDPPDGLHGGGRGGDDGQETGGHENDTEHEEDYENFEEANDEYDDDEETDQNCGDCCPICLNCCFYDGQIGCKTQYYRISCLIKNIPTITEKPPREDLKLENPCLRSSHLQPSNSASSSQGHLSPSQANPDIPNKDDEKKTFFKSDVISSHSSPAFCWKWRTPQLQLYLLGIPGTNKYEV